MSLSVQISHLKDNLQLQIKRFINKIAIKSTYIHMDAEYNEYI